jgi:hypothetical protein
MVHSKSAANRSPDLLLEWTVRVTAQSKTMAVLTVHATEMTIRQTGITRLRILILLLKKTKINSATPVGVDSRAGVWFVGVSSTEGSPCTKRLHALKGGIIKINCQKI